LYLLHLIKANDKAATGRKTWLSGNWFLRTDIVFSLKMAHLCRNMLQMLS